VDAGGNLSVFPGKVDSAMPNPSRRQFLSAGLMLPVAGAASKFPILQSDRGAGRPAAGPPNLDHRTIGKTGLKVTSGRASGA
jgi:hypothetical protein